MDINKILRNWGENWERVLCTTYRCGHEWDVPKDPKAHSNTHDYYKCTWCGGKGKKLS